MRAKAKTERTKKTKISVLIFYLLVLLYCTKDDAVHKKFP